MIVIQTPALCVPSPTQPFTCDLEKNACSETETTHPGMRNIVGMKNTTKTGAETLLRRKGKEKKNSMQLPRALNVTA